MGKIAAISIPLSITTGIGNKPLFPYRIKWSQVFNFEAFFEMQE
jgi:hypothetical protein